MKLRTLAVTAMMLLLSSAFAIAAEPPSSGWLQQQEHPDVKVRLAFTGQIKDGKALATLEVQLDNDWKTYWRAPGEGGVAPSFNHQQLENIAAVEWLWPLPQTYSLQGLNTIGYQNNVVFPLLVELNEQGAFNWQTTLTLSTCTTVCVLTEYQINLSGDTSQWAVDSQRAERFQIARSRVPVQRNTPIEAVWDNDRQLLSVSSVQGIEQIYFYSDDADLNELTFANTRTESGEAIVEVDHWLETPDLSGLEQDQVIAAVIVDETGAFQAPLGITAGAVNNLPTTVHSLPVILLFALLGGLILNVMPCVLPVLGIKLRSLIQSQQQTHTRTKFLASAAGIISTFFALGIVVAVMKLSGQSVGWGMQFQNPWFLGALVLITAVFSANLLGLFEIRMPQGMSQKLAAQKTSDSHRGDFLQGVIATLLATPCTAPFLGTAVAFAMGAGIVVQLTLFVALGVGMALPWLLVAAKPSLVRFLPKPGRWLNWIKPVFGIMMGLTTLWLLSLLIIHHLAPATAAPDPGWQTFEQEKIAAAVDDDQVVFVDVTADWCLTCKANKRAVIEQNPVATRLAEADMTLLQADWTTPSDNITDYLRQHNRYGVPFNIVYGPAAPEGIALPVILTDSAVLDAIEQAK
ncbi:suppressor for copper-sensitivity B [Idiomarina aquatica]|uniref:Suppressor for copper-sensitivity B n=1 Tax=Idiomarina aquatica TaxID=1327752 RepID=A0A4R6PQH9_9GAMM|nr:protein-disulfide reductase DsbD domain-containing protein [Idiomarina aquatica]TDP40596.1 suppressor for copper-sensitivity B [Idiomarina aquatica]